MFYFRFLLVKLNLIAFLVHIQAHMAEVRWREYCQCNDQAKTDEFFNIELCELKDSEACI